VPAGAVTTGPEQEVSPAFFGNGVAGGYSPENLRSAYELPSTSAGAGQTVAVVDAFDDPDAESDMNTYRSEYGIAECTASNGCFRKVNEKGGTSYPAPEKVWAKEISLDLDMVSAICPNCHILLVEASEATSASLANAENRAAAMGATEISNSYTDSGEESVLASDYDHPGIPITAAAGDHGYGTQSPASNPHVIAVGGTTLKPAANSRGWTESVWYEDAGGLISGTGSGCSTEPKPAWQPEGDCGRFRTANDVAAVADQNTPVSAYDSYETQSPWLLLGGTSAATPIVASAMALANTYTRSFEGADALYIEEANGGAGLNDVVSGSNGSCGDYLCEAGPGYDGPSGVGSLHGAPEVQPPSYATGEATSIEPTQATLNATVDPHGVSISECEFEYGTTTSYGTRASCSPLPGPQTTPVTVSASISGLTADTPYHFRVAVVYEGGSGRSADQTFTTAALHLPSVETNAASAVTQTTASLNAQVNPNGTTVSKCTFEYGPTTSYEFTAQCTPAPGGGQAPVAVSAPVSGLTAHGTYHFRVVATNHDGTSYGNDQTLTMLADSPTTVTEAASSITQTSATLNATVNPNGSAVTLCEFEFASSENYVPCATLPGAEEVPVAVSASLHSLSANATFGYRIIAGNAGGTTYGPIVSFTTQAITSSPFTPSAPATATTPTGETAQHPPATTLPPMLDAQLSGTSLLASASGQLTLKVLCPAADAACAGTITLRTLTAVAASGHSSARHILTLAAGRFAAGAGRVVPIKLHLSAGARGLLAHMRVLRARATIVTEGASGSASGATVTLRALRAPAGGSSHKG
jgi:hypothetical protein